MFLQVHYTIFGVQSIHRKCELLRKSQKKFKKPIDKYLEFKLYS